MGGKGKREETVSQRRSQLAADELAETEWWKSEGGGSDRGTEEKREQKNACGFESPLTKPGDIESICRR